MKVVNVAQKSQEWLDWRKGGIGASDVSALFNDVEVKVPYFDMIASKHDQVVVSGSPFQTVYGLWRLKTGRDNPPDLSKNPDVQRGNALEDEARAAASADFGQMLVPVCAQHDEHPFIRVSFDAVFPDGRTLEIKAPGAKVYAKAKAGGPTAYYVWQVIDQMAVSEHATHGYLYLYRCDEDALIYRFDREDVQHMIDMAIERQKVFWNQVVFDQPPEIDPKRDTVDLTGNADFHAYSMAWVEAKAEEQRIKVLYDEAKARRQEAEGGLAQCAGNYSLASNELVKFTRFTRQGSVDYAKLVADKLGEVPDIVLDPYRRKSSEQIKVSVVKPS